jgi:hypothetical protein
MLVDRVPGQPLGTTDSFGISYSAAPDPTDRYFFSLSHLLSQLHRDTVKAHRQTDPAGDGGKKTPADVENFRFSSDSLKDIDEVWLVGYNDVRPGDPGLTPSQQASVLGDDELAALTTFMNAGGGVYAVGDHAGLGLSLSGFVPRVRTMRRWWYPSPSRRFGNEPVAPPATSGVGGERLDSTRPGYDVAPRDDPQRISVFFDDQSDDIPQYLHLSGAENMCVDPRVYAINPQLVHPLLQGPSGPILAFPDHMHEGEVILPYELDRVFQFAGQQFEEYPFGPNGQVLPQVIARSFSNDATSFVTPDERPAHVGDTRGASSRSFGAIGAYDGHLANVGRVVVESTFHHFMDINVIGDPVAPAGSAKQHGFETPDGEGVLRDLGSFYTNVIHWLAPPGFKWSRWSTDIVVALSNRTLREMATNPLPGGRIQIGETVAAVLSPKVPSGILVDRMLAVLPSAVRDSLPAFPWGPTSGTNGCGSVDFQQMLHLALGEAAISAARLSDGRGSQSLLDDPEAQRVIVEAAHRGVASLADEFEEHGSGLVQIARALREGSARSETTSDHP